MKCLLKILIYTPTGSKQGFVKIQIFKEERLIATDEIVKQTLMEGDLATKWAEGVVKVVRGVCLMYIHKK